MSDSAATENDHRGTIVLLAGSATTLLALAAVFALNHHGVNVMGWYANYILPVGALMVGMLAASGYGIAGWITGLKMTPRLIASMLAELFVSYLLAHYSEYSQLVDGGSIAGFFDWFDQSTRSFRWDDHGHVGEALGALGYGLRALELVGFIGGGAAVPLILRGKPYCDPCRTYKRTKMLAVLPAGVSIRAFRRTKAEEREAVANSAQQGVEVIFDAAHNGDRARLQAEIEARGPLARQRAAQRLSARVTIALHRCPKCADGALVAAIVTGQGNQRRVRHLKSHALPPDRMRPLFD